MRSTLVKELLKQFGLKPKDLADATHFTEPQISKWGSKETTLRPSTAKIVMQFFASKSLDNSQLREYTGDAK